MRYAPFIVILLATTLCPAQEMSTDALEGEIREILEKERLAHLNYDADALLSLQAEKLLSVQRGKMEWLSMKDRRELFEHYFSSVTFEAWDTMGEPVIQISHGGAFAVVSLVKNVVLTRRNAENNSEPEQYLYAWTATYEKREGNWVMTSITSTSAP
jgi:hypothetical protein